MAPNLGALIGDIVGARLISHAGSLTNLAKYPASTVQILGAEKALFRALKAKHDTPKYGLIYHASLIGQAAPKHKGKISRVLAAKCALSIRVDALTQGDVPMVGVEHRMAVENRLRQLEEQLRAQLRPQVAPRLGAQVAPQVGQIAPQLGAAARVRPSRRRPRAVRAPPDRAGLVAGASSRASSAGPPTRAQSPTGP